jgi:hypothetical protein
MQRELRNGELAPSTGTIIPWNLLNTKRAVEKEFPGSPFSFATLGLTHGFAHQPPAGFEPAGGLREYLNTCRIGAYFRSESPEENHP